MQTNRVLFSCMRRLSNSNRNVNENVTENLKHDSLSLENRYFREQDLIKTQCILNALKNADYVSGNLILEKLEKMVSDECKKRSL